jgi:hypothetical protein
LVCGEPVADFARSLLFFNVFQFGAPQVPHIVEALMQSIEADV